MNAELSGRLHALIADASGLAEDEFGDDEEFVSLGLDSLFLTQLAGLLQARYGVPLGFKQLVNEFPTVHALARWLEGQGVRVEAAPPASPAMPPPVTPSAVVDSAIPLAAPVVPVPVPRTLTGDGAPLTTVLAEQLRLMEQQLQLLQGLAVQGPQATTAAAVPAVVAPPAVAAPVLSLVPQAPALLEEGPTATRSADRADSNVVPLFVAAEPAGNPALEGLSPAAVPAGGACSDMPANVQRHIDALVRAWNAKTPGSRSSTAAWRDRHADPRTAAGFNQAWKDLVYPVVVEHAAGARLRDIDGNVYIDLLNGFGPGLFGHSPPEVVDALRRQLESGFPIGPQTPLAGEVAALICELTGNERATLVNTGSEAVAAALRVARTVTGRVRIVVFDGDYHGNFDEVLVRGGRDGRARPMAPGIPQSAVDNVTVLPFGAPEALAWLAEHGAEVAAVLVEPVQSRFPERRPREFMQALRTLATQQGACLIFDEVITGFRAGLAGAQGHYGVRADLVTYGKIVGGGMPIGVVAGTARFMDAFDGGTWSYGDDSSPQTGVTFIAGTFVRHPLAVVAAHAVLSRLKREGPALYVELDRRAAWLANGLDQLFTTFGVDIEVVHFTSQLWLRIGNRNPFTRLLFHHVRLRGIYIQEGFPTYLTTAHTDADIEAVLTAFRESLVLMARDGVIDAPAGWAGEVFPLATDQQDLWIAAEMDEHTSCAYNESDSLWLHGALDEASLRRAWSILVSRHQVFHLRVLPDGSGQVVQAAAGPAITHLDLSDRSPADCEDVLRALYARQSDQPFDLSAGPLHRPFLIRHPDDDRGARHQFVLYAHHLVHDGWTANVLFSELASIYNALCANARVELPPPLAFAAFIAERAAREAATGRAHATWWLGELGSLTTVGALPADKAVPAVRSHAGDTLHLEADASLGLRLVQLARQCRVTRHTLMLGAFGLLSMALQRRNETLIGVPRASQAEAVGGSVAGMGVKLLPLRLQARPQATVSEYLQDVRVLVTEAQEHGVLGWSDLLRLPEFADCVRGGLRVDAIFNFSHYFAAAQFTGLEADVRENPRVRTHFDTFVHVTERQDRIDIDWDFSTERFASQSVAAWGRLYLDLLVAMAADPQRPVAELLTGTGSIAEPVTAVAGPAPLTGTPAVRDAVTRIVEQLVSAPGQTVIVAGGHTFSRGWLLERSAAIAQTLHGHGTVAGDTVAIATERTADMLAAMLGVLRLGANYLPVDQNYPARRIAHVLSHSGVRTALVDAATRRLGDAGFEDVACIRVDDIGAADARAVDAEVDPATPAYVIYTSGSTGLPKGVVVSRGALANYLAGILDVPGIAADDRVLAQTTIAFDIHVTEIWGSLTAGATVVLATQEEAADGLRLRALIEDHAVSVMQATPATWRLLKEAAWKPVPHFKGLIGGEAVPIDLVSHYAPLLASLWNMYGPTEATVWASCCRLVADGRTPPIGKPLPGYRFHVLDDRRRAVPRGNLGELAISGTGLATGYHRDEEKTAAAFPLLELEGGSQRVYLTGDLVVQHPDGNYVFHARKDSQIKLRGYRIEPGEIEHAIHGSGLVSEAIVLFKAGDQDGDGQLIAFVVMNPGVDLDTLVLRKAIAASLPRYMLPARIVGVAAMPRTDNGKVDRLALLQQADVVQTSALRGSPPESPAERTVARLWQELVGTVDIRREDSFFDVGGHSLMTLKFLNRLREETGVRLRVRDVVFEDLQGIAALVDAGSAPRTQGGWWSRLMG